MKRKKLANRTFILILAPIMCLIMVGLIGFQVFANNYGYLLDIAFGTGERQVLIPEGVDDWDTDYYPEISSYTKDNVKENSLKVNLDIARESMVLLKNDGVLPLSKGASISPFGKGYWFPFYDSPNGGGSMKHSFLDNVKPWDALKDAGFNMVDHAANLQPVWVTSGTTNNIRTLTPAQYSLSATDGPNYNTYEVPGSPANTISATQASFGASNRLPELNVSAYDALTPAEKNELAPTTALVFISRSGSEGMDLKFDEYDDGTPHKLALSQNEKDMIKKAKELTDKVVILINSTNPMELQDVAKAATEELGVNAILWVGNPGENGFKALPEILCGDVNPSARLYDIFPTDFRLCPELESFGNMQYHSDHNYPGASGSAAITRYVEYSEGVYMGYRFYETAHHVATKVDTSYSFEYGTLKPNGEVDTPGSVVYPFGYGMSYTTFTQTVESFSTDGNDITMTVKVTNTGSKAGKEVVQIYYNPPYGQIDKDNRIEKPAKNLAAFAKTAKLNPLASETLKLTFPKEQMASYSDFRKNPDGSNGCYVLTEGDYEIMLSKDSHNVIETKKWTNTNTIWYDNTNPRQLEKDMQAEMDEDGKILDKIANPNQKNWIAATNLYEDLSDYMYEESNLKRLTGYGVLTRAAWKQSVPVNRRVNAAGQPSGVVGATIHASETINRNGVDVQVNYGDALLANNKKLSEKTTKTWWRDKNPDFATNEQMGGHPNSPNYVAPENMPKGNMDYGLTIMDLRGKSFWHEDWQKLLDQIDWVGDKNAIQAAISGAQYFTHPIPSIGMPYIYHVEGANGVRVGNSYALNKLTTTWAMTPMLAATFNTDLAYEHGKAMSAESLVFQCHARMSPAFNMHRGPFTGRNLEYFSEDPYLTGRIVTRMLDGSTSGGMIEHIKHFGLNDQETNRSNNLYTWATEQTVREIYNKPFEMAIRDSRKTVRFTEGADGEQGKRVMRGANAMMSSQSKLGTTTAFSHYNLQQKQLREEWAWSGTVITDWFTVDANWSEFVMLSGGDTVMPGSGSYASPTVRQYPNYNTATMRTAIRNTIHRVAFNIANSNALQNAPSGTVIHMTQAAWEKAIIVIHAVGWPLIGLGGVWIALRIILEKKNPQKYFNWKRDDSPVK